MMPGRCQGIQGREPCSLLPVEQFDVLAERAGELRFPGYGREHSRDEEQATALHSFGICPQWLRHWRHIDPEFSNSIFSGGDLGSHVLPPSDVRAAVYMQYFACYVLCLSQIYDRICNVLSGGD